MTDTRHEAEKVPPPSWKPLSDEVKAKAHCKGLDPNTFYPAQNDRVTQIKAKQICSECVVKDACLEWALCNNMPHGIWGGKSERERRGIRRRRSKRMPL